MKCLICEHEAKPLDSGGPGLALRCRECGSYQVDDRLLARLRQGRDILDEQQARIRLHVRRAGHHGLPRLDAADADLLQPARGSTTGFAIFPVAEGGRTTTRVRGRPS